MMIMCKVARDLNSGGYTMNPNVAIRGLNHLLSGHVMSAPVHWALSRFETK